MTFMRIKSRSVLSLSMLLQTCVAFPQPADFDAELEDIKPSPSPSAQEPLFALFDTVLFNYGAIPDDMPPRELRGPSVNLLTWPDVSNWNWNWAIPEQFELQFAPGVAYPKWEPLIEAKTLQSMPPGPSSAVEASTEIERQVQVNTRQIAMMRSESSAMHRFVIDCSMCALLVLIICACMPRRVSAAPSLEIRDPDPPVAKVV